MPDGRASTPGQRRLRTLAYVRFGSAATRLGNAQRAAQIARTPAADVARADALTSLRDCRAAFIVATGRPVEAIDPTSDLMWPDPEDVLDA